MTTTKGERTAHTHTMRVLQRLGIDRSAAKIDAISDEEFLSMQRISNRTLRRIREYADAIAGRTLATTACACCGGTGGAS